MKMYLIERDSMKKYEDLLEVSKHQDIEVERLEELVLELQEENKVLKIQNDLLMKLRS